MSIFIWYMMTGRAECNDAIFICTGLLKLEDVASLVTDTPTTVSRPSTMSTTSEGCTCVCPSTP